MSSPGSFDPPENDDHEHDVVIEGIPLSQVVANKGPFLTCYLRSGDDLKERLEAVLAGRADISSELGTVARTLCPESLAEGALCLVANESGPGHAFQMADPIRRDVFRAGTVPSLGSLVESASLLPSHAIVTGSEAGFSVASFGSSTVPSSELGTLGEYGTAAEVVTALGFRSPAKIVVVGDPVRSESLVSDLATAFPDSLVSHHDGISRTTSAEAVADMIVTSAASLRAELITLELGRFRAARDEGVTVEEFGVVDAVTSGRVSSVLLHDDPDDERTIGNDRLVDVVTSAALRRRIPLTLIPDVPVERGPAGGVGAILKGDAGKLSGAQPVPEAAAAAVPQPKVGIA